VKFIPIQFPEKNRLFGAYLEKSASIRPFYDRIPGDPLTDLLLQLSRRSYPRDALVSMLKTQNQGWGAESATLDNIERLKNSHTLAVVTGQQAGVFGGPLYTIFKVMTAIQQSIFLNNQFPDYHFVPIFWMEVDDSDFDEIHHIQYIDKHNRLQRLELPEPESEQGKPIFLRTLPPEITDWFHRIRDDFFDTEFKSDVLNHYARCYTPGRPYTDALACLLLSLFSSHGLIVLNPTAPEIKQLGRPFFETLLHGGQELITALQERNRQLQQAGFDPQVHINPRQTFLFFIDEDGRRVRIDREDARTLLFKYPEGYRPAPREQVLELLEKHPERFTTNVVSRPLFQDRLLPTIIYIAGPAEVAYFAQLHSIYQQLNIPMPVIHPRHRFTLVESKIQKILQKYQLDYPTIFEKQHQILKEWLQREANAQPVIQTFLEIQQHVDRQLKTFLPALEAFDPTLIKALQHTRASIQSNLNKFQQKLERSLQNRHQTLTRQLEKMLLHFFPQHAPQERVLNMIYFQIKYGWQFPDQLLERMPADTLPHWIVEL